MRTAPPSRTRRFCRARVAAACIATLTLAASAAGQNGDKEGETQPPLPDDLVVPPAPVLGPEEALQSIAVPRGYRVELVAAEPLVVDPIQIVFDQRGRMWVVEMRGYMPDPAATGEKEPVGCIAILSDTDGDGRMDHRQVFADGLVLPRSVHPCEGGALVVAPPQLLFLADDDGDGKLDRRELIDPKVGGLDNPEHAINGLLYGRDNWYHLANWSFQYRRIDGVWASRRTNGGGQWGLTQDDVGRLFFNTNSDPLRGDVVGSLYARRNPHQRGFVGANVQVASDGSTWPSRITPGVNRGYQKNTLRPDYTLRNVTAACAPLVYRGGAFGDDGEGDVFVCEPAANLVKRYRLERDATGTGLTARGIVLDKRDFLTSTDERFRPVALATGPDGGLYVADFQRGIIQHRIYMTSFLRKQVDERGLAAPVGLGRIYRVVADGAPRHPVPDLSAASWSDLIAALSHPSGAVRDNAQRLFVEDWGGESDVATQLRQVARTASDPRTRIHALWILEGVDELTVEVLAAALRDPDPRVRHTGLRVAEPWLALQGNDLVGQVLRVGLVDTDAWVRLQALLTLGSVSSEPAELGLAALASGDLTNTMVRSAVVSGLRFRERAFIERLAADPRWREAREGRAQLLTDLAACVARERLAEHVTVVLELALTPPADWWGTALLEGLLAARDKGPTGEPLPLRLAAAPAAVLASTPAVSDAAAARLALVSEGCTWPGKPGAVEPPPVRPLTPAEELLFARGAEVYNVVCATCHQPHGGGEPGKAPTLRGSPWALGDPERFAKILLHGLTGPIHVDGENWNMEMPRFEGSAEELAAVATFVRRSWGNGAEPLTLDLVERVRKATAGRTQPFTTAELK
jgi:mono/diheme cytochrome c family protein/glucose/arabinose dehydrogenase